MKGDGIMIKDNSKKIIQYLLDQAISCGDLEALFLIQYDTLAKELRLENGKLCRVCCQYLDRLGYINIVDNDDGGGRLTRLTARGIDFLESNH